MRTPDGAIKWGLVLCLAASPTAAEADRRLIEAVKKGNRDAVRTLAKQKAIVNAVDSDGTTALHWTVRANNLETSQLLIASGANVKTADRYGITPIILAAENGNAPMVQV